MFKVNFKDLGAIENEELKYAVIVANYKGKWIFVRHKDRDTWEVPGGHREHLEDIEVAASRELYEETGAKEFELTPICIYSVCRDEKESFGQLFYGQVHTLGELPNLEIREIKLMEDMPEGDKLTYPLIQPYLFKRARKVINNKK